MKNKILAAVTAFGLVLGANAILGTNTVAAQKAMAETATATFAGGCFWCIESDFDKVPGVLATVSGYTGGKTDNPTYEQVTAGNTGHREAVRIVFDPRKTSYERLLEIFWRSVDPTDAGGQFCDRGESYQTAVYATTDAQLRIAETSKAKLAKSGALAEPVVTPVHKAGSFFPAETYHQNYHEKNPIRYKFYRYACGRDARVRKVWGAEAYRGLPRS